MYYVSPHSNAGITLTLSTTTDLKTFNALLYQDIQTHGYAYLLDTNLNLSYDHDMFSRRNGWLNNNGMRNVFRDLNYLIADIKSYSKDNENNNECIFFRD